MGLICWVHGCRKWAKYEIEVLSYSGGVACHFPVCDWHKEHKLICKTGMVQAIINDNGEIGHGK